MSTRAEIRDWVRQQTLIDTDDFAADKLNNVINQGVREVGDSDRWPFLEETAALIIEDGADSYALPADFATMIAVYDADGDQVPEITRRLAHQNYPGVDPTEPEAWYFYGNEIVFVPAPDTTYHMTLDYNRQPTELASDSDSPEWHPAYHMILADYAAHKIWEREEDLERSTYHRQLYELGIQRMRMHYRNRGEDNPLIVGDAVQWHRYPWAWQRG